MSVSMQNDFASNMGCLFSFSLIFFSVPFKVKYIFAPDFLSILKRTPNIAFL